MYARAWKQCPNQTALVSPWGILVRSPQGPILAPPSRVEAASALRFRWRLLSSGLPGARFEPISGSLPLGHLPYTPLDTSSAFLTRLPHPVLCACVLRPKDGCPQLHAFLCGNDAQAKFISEFLGPSPSSATGPQKPPTKRPVPNIRCKKPSYPYQSILKKQPPSKPVDDTSPYEKISNTSISSDTTIQKEVKNSPNSDDFLGTKNKASFGKAPIFPAGLHPFRRLSSFTPRGSKKPLPFIRSTSTLPIFKDVSKTTFFEFLPKFPKKMQENKSKLLTSNKPISKKAPVKRAKTILNPNAKNLENTIHVASKKGVGDRNTFIGGNNPSSLQVTKISLPEDSRKNLPISRLLKSFGSFTDLYIIGPIGQTRTKSFKPQRKKALPLKDKSLNNKNNLNIFQMGSRASTVSHDFESIKPMPSYSAKAIRKIKRPSIIATKARQKLTLPSFKRQLALATPKQQGLAPQKKAGSSIPLGRFLEGLVPESLFQKEEKGIPRKSKSKRFKQMSLVSTCFKTFNKNIISSDVPFPAKGAPSFQRYPKPKNHIGHRENAKCARTFTEERGTTERKIKKPVKKRVWLSKFSLNSESINNKKSHTKESGYKSKKTTDTRYHFQEVNSDPEESEAKQIPLLIPLNQKMEVTKSRAANKRRVLKSNISRDSSRKTVEYKVSAHSRAKEILPYRNKNKALSNCSFKTRKPKVFKKKSVCSITSLLNQNPNLKFYCKDFDSYMRILNYAYSLKYPRTISQATQTAYSKWWPDLFEQINKFRTSVGSVVNGLRYLWRPYKYLQDDAQNSNRRPTHSKAPLRYGPMIQGPEDAASIRRFGKVTSAVAVRNHFNGATMESIIAKSLVTKMREIGYIR